MVDEYFIILYVNIFEKVQTLCCYDQNLNHLSAKFVHCMNIVDGKIKQRNLCNWEQRRNCKKVPNKENKKKYRY